jgi:hypothetical protein
MSGLFSRRSVELLIAMCVIAPFVAHAQTVDRDQFQMFLSTKFNKDLIARALSGVPPEVFHTCPALAPIRSKVDVEKSIVFGGDGVPIAGAWWERLPVRGCGNDTVLNIHFHAHGDGTVDTLFALPGSTRADPTLQRNAAQYALMGAGARAPDCRQFYVKNTLFGGNGLKQPPDHDPGKDARLRAWWETWTVTGCGRSYDVLMEFMPDANGTRIVQPQGQIREY